MSTKASEFLDNISDLSPVIAKARDAIIEYWSPDAPPITIAFANIGHAIVDNIEEIDNGAQRAVFLMIEDAISSQDEQLSTAVATGLIEGIVGRATKRGNFLELLTKLGTNSQAHARVWHDG